MVPIRVVAKCFARIRLPGMVGWFLVGFSTKCFARIRHPEMFGWFLSRVVHKMFREDSPQNLFIKNLF